MAEQDMIAEADAAWRNGRLGHARDGYARVLEATPDRWHAAFQVAWIDAAFKPLSIATLSTLARPSLPASIGALVEMLGLRNEEIGRGDQLAGSIEDWDIDRLCASPEASEVTFWMRRAKAAMGTRQYGLADACFAEARAIDPAGFQTWPTDMRNAPANADSHLAAIRSVTG